MALPAGIAGRCCYVWFTCWAVTLAVQHSIGCHVADYTVTGAALITALIVYLSFLKVDGSGRGVLITGCSSGFGYQLAVRLHACGFTVFAGLHTAEGASADRLRSLGVHVLQLDVTDQLQVDQAVHYVQSHLPANGLWALVNNAGVAVMCYAEWIPAAFYDRIVDVNLKGTVRMTLAFLPLLRRSGGRVVNVTSGGGRVPLIFHAPYVASKFGVEGFSDVLRVELKSFGVKVVVVEPCNYTAGTRIFRTDVADQIRHFWHDLPHSNRRGYTSQHLERCVSLCQSFVDSGAKDLTPAIDVLQDSVCRIHPRSRYGAGNLSALFMMNVLPHLPERVTDFFFENLLSWMIDGS